MSLALTMMQNLRSNGNIDKYEYRASRYGAFSLFQKQTKEANGIITPEMEQKFWGSIGRTFETPVIDYDKNVTIQVGQTRTLEIADSENTSRMISITPTTLSFGFTMFPTLFHNNEIGYQKDFNTKMLKYLNAMAVQLDNMCIAKLTAERTQVLGNSLGYTFADGMLSSTAAQKEHLIGALEAMMNSNDFYDTIDLVGETGLQDLIAQLRQHGMYNDQNKQMEYAGKNLYFTNRIATGSGNSAKGFAVNAGSVGLLWRVDREALARTKSRTGREWDSGVLPMLNVPVGTMYYESDGDYSAIAGAASADMTASHKQHFGYSVDVALVCAYNSLGAERATPIIEFEIKA